MPKTFILHDETLNSYGFWVRTAGIDLSQFKRNPVMLFQHIRPGNWEAGSGTDKLLPIGYWENIRVDGDKLLADAVFDQDDEFALRIESKVENDVLRMASLGLRPVAWSEDKKDIKPGQTRPTLTKSIAQEGSIVDRGSNNNALRLYNEDDQIISLSADAGKCDIPLIDNSTKTIDNMKTVKGLLKLADDANEAEVFQAIQRLFDEKNALETEKTQLESQVQTLKDKEKEGRKEQIKNLLDQAVTDRKITANQRDTYEKLAEADYDSVKAILDNMKGVKTLADEIDHDSDDNEKFKGWTFDDFSQKDPDRLAEIKLKEPERYKKLYRDKFKKDPA